jgi:hypothetical protein
MSLNVATVVRPMWRDSLICRYLAAGAPRCLCFERVGIKGVYHRFGYLMEYMNFFLKRGVEAARARGLNLKDFDGYCRREDLKADLDSRNPIFILHGAHGGRNVVTSDDAPGLAGSMLYLLCSPPRPELNYQVACPSPNHSWLRGRVMYTLSCLSASVLGEEAVKAGALAYLGWRDLLWVMVVRSEIPDVASWDEACWDACLAGVVKLLDGGSAREAREETYKRFSYWIDYYNAHRDPYGIWLITQWVLLTDRDGFVQLGNPDARVASPTHPLWFALQLAGAVAPIGVVLGVVGSEELRKAGVKI